MMKMMLPPFLVLGCTAAALGAYCRGNGLEDEAQAEELAQ